MQRRAERSRGLRRARRGVLSHDALAATGVDPLAASMCMGCGLLVPPPPPGDPMRTDPLQSVTDGSACAHCGACGRAALGDPDTVEALCELEHREHAVGRARVVARIALVGAVGVAAAIAAASVVATELVALNLLGLMLVSVALERVIAFGVGSRRAAFRWRAPTLRPRAGATIANGALGGSTTTRSPLSGRAGLAWRIEVRHVGAPADRFALIEQGCAPLVVAGTPVGIEPVIAMVGAACDDDQPQVRAYLRSRGIESHDALEVREVVLVEGDTVELCRGRGASPPVLRAA